jgi:hypothetical protein
MLITSCLLPNSTYGRFDSNSRKKPKKIGVVDIVCSYQTLDTVDLMQILTRHTLTRTESALKIAPAKNRCSVLSFFGHITHHTAALREKASADDELRSPAPGKTVANFYSQTAHNWNEEAAKLAGELAADQVESIPATKELKHKGFCLAGLKGYSCSVRRKGRRRRPRRSQKISLFGWQGQG